MNEVHPCLVEGVWGLQPAGSGSESWLHNLAAAVTGMIPHLRFVCGAGRKTPAHPTARGRGCGCRHGEAATQSDRQAHLHHLTQEFLWYGT